MKMASKVAAGLVIYRNHSGNNQYLLLRASYGERHWTPPKGHVDPGETNEMVTALRETREESGLTENDFNVIDDSEKELNYPVKGKPKRVVYWLAKLINQQANVQLSDEHTEYKWLQLKEACEHVKYDSTVNLLTYYESFINKNNLS